jgi:hypothetical protein
MSRLQPTDPLLCNPYSPVDTAITCFVVSQRDDPTFLSIDELRERQWCDTAYTVVLPHWGSCESIYIDDHGMMRYLRTSGEFQVIVTDMIPTAEPIAVVREVTDLFLTNSLLSTRDEDATDSRR